MKNLLKLVVYPFVFIGGLMRFIVTGKNGNQGYLAFRYLFVLTNGKSNDLASKIISILIPQYKDEPKEGILSSLSNSEIGEVVDNLNKDGFHIFDIKLSPEKIEELTKFATSTPVRYLQFDKKYITYSTEEVLFDESNPISPRFQFRNSQLINDPAIQDLVFDQSLLRIANRFLKTKPVLDIITMWWSLPFSKEAEDKAAQKYHFDMDRFKFMKFFFYINDVGPDNGPHCYVRGSSKNIPTPLLQDRRIEDEEIAANYPAQDILELTAPAGTIMAVDTRGFHKGKSLSKGKRLLLQLQFSNSVFGSPHNKINDANLSSKSVKLKREKSRTYRLIN